MLHSPGGCHSWFALLAVTLAAGCIAAPLDAEKPGLPDGSECEHDQDCRSQGCNHDRLCTHSLCDCPGNTCAEGGEVSKDCQSGWVCVYYRSVLHGVGEFFGADGDDDGGYCQATCKAGCPAHYHCTGELCAPDANWAAPVASVHWTGGAEGSLSGGGRTASVKLELGKTVTLTASAESPVHLAIDKFQWTITGGNGEPSLLEGMSVDVTLDSGSYRRAELTVGDAEGRSAQLTISLDACSGPGTACGYQGSGCCTACDDKKMFCL